MIDTNYDIKCFYGNKNMPILMYSSKNLFNSQLEWHIYYTNTDYVKRYLTYKNEGEWIEWNN